MRYNGILLHDKQVFVPELNNLWLQVLKAKYNYQLVGHLGQSKIYQLIQQEYSWPNIYVFVKEYMRTCNTYMQNKLKHHKLYGLLK